MTLPYEEQQSLKNARMFMESLLDNKKVPKDVRRHWPPCGDFFRKNL